MATDERVTAYSVILYPDSCDIEKCKTTIDRMHLRACLSPLHDEDIYDRVDSENWVERKKKALLTPDDETAPEVGNKKKPHYHLLVTFGKNKKSVQQMLDIVHEFSPTTKYVEPVRDLFVLTRYQCHLDSRHKHKYPVEMCEAFNGFDLSPLFVTSKDGKRSALGRVCKWATEYHIYSMVDLTELVLMLDEPSLFDAIVERSNFVGRFLDDLFKRDMNNGEYCVNVHAVCAAIRSGKGQEPVDVSELKEVS